MYPTKFTELMALIAVLIPLIIGTVAGLRNARTRGEEFALVRWRRLNEIAVTLYNKNGVCGLWAQLAAATELGETRGRQKRAALLILESAEKHFSDNLALKEACQAAIKKVS